MTYWINIKEHNLLAAHERADAVYTIIYGKRLGPSWAIEQVPTYAQAVARSITLSEQTKSIAVTDLSRRLILLKKNWPKLISYPTVFDLIEAIQHRDQVEALIRA